MAAKAGGEPAPMTDRALNRALLARQGLLEPFDAPVPEVVERIGAIQSQYWPAATVALFSRMTDVKAADVHAALAAGSLVNGILIRGTLHMVTAREHPEYSAVAESSGTNDWRRHTKLPQPAMDEVLAELAEFAGEQPRTPADFAAFIESWLAGRPDVLDAEELAKQRATGWKAFLRSSRYHRVPADGLWDTVKGPAESKAAAPFAPDPAAATTEVVRRHLRAFGPAAAEDVAYWTGLRTPQVRTVLTGLGDELVRFTDSAGKLLYDLPDAPRPDAGTAVPVKMLPWFDSSLLAYDSKRRQRILPDEYKDIVYLKKNLQLLPTFLIDGLVAGTWALQAKPTRGGSATVTLRPLAPVGRTDRETLAAEAERLVRFARPEVAQHSVVFED